MFNFCSIHDAQSFYNFILTFLCPYIIILLQHSGGAPFSSGVVQQQMEGGQYLSWIRPLSYTDSGRYEFVAANSEGECTTSVEITVLCMFSIRWKREQ